MTEKTPPIHGVAEIVLSVRDIAKMREFYSRVLGFEFHSQSSHPPDGEPDDEPTICFLTIRPLDSLLGQNGHPQLLALIDYQRHVHAIKRFDGHNVRQSTLNHLAFEIPTDSYAQHWERLEQLGLDPIASEFPDMNAKAMFFKDPEGNQLELICHWNFDSRTES